MDDYAYQAWPHYAAQHHYQQYQQYQPYHPYPQQQQPQFAQTTAPSLPPWRITTQSMTSNARPAKGRDRQVDSWRSYSTDTTNLQSTTVNTASLNASAATFEPASSQNTALPEYKPYESLRVSNGTAERRVVEANNAANAQTKSRSKRKNKNKAAISDVPLPEPSNRYPLRSKKGEADTPLPSIEIGDPARPGTSIHATLPFRYATPRKTGTKSPEAPVASSGYCAAAQKQPSKLTEPRKLLVILDLNGTLLYRNRSNWSVHVRPGVTPFIDYIFKNHTVMIYTSATPHKAQDMVKSFLHPSHRNKLAAVWARDKLDLTEAQYRNKVQVYKKLDRVWNDGAIQKTAEPGSRWNQSNTILIDDSRLKALSQPYNLVQVPEYTPANDPKKTADEIARAAAYKVQQDIMRDLQQKIEELQIQEDVSRLIRKWQAGEIESSHQIQEGSVRVAVNEKEFVKPREIQSFSNAHLPTPESLVDETDGGVPVRPVSEKDHEQERSGSVSSIDEDVFRELLEGTGK